MVYNGKYATIPHEPLTNLHDCPFDLPRERFDASAQTWIGLFLRPVWEDPLAQHTGWRLYGSTRLPVVEGKFDANRRDGRNS